ncbi:MAG: hypothetical protein Q9187_005739 [Circinaria calcarea]
MLTALRSGRTSLGRSLFALAAPSSSKCAVSSWIICRERQPVQPKLIARTLHSSPLWRRSATAAAEVEADENLIEGQIDEGIGSQRPLSDSEINASLKRGPVTRFRELAERGMVSPTVVKTLTEDMRLETMTQVQSLTINETLKGIDVLAQARTGTGKTLAFLIPVLQNIISYDPSLEARGKYGRNRSSPTDIRAIIISPTRELAEQIAVEARKVVKNTGVIVQTAVGGSAKAYGLRKIRTEGCHILIGTPGRLNDILSDPYSEVRAPNLSAFVLDEADRLLDQGFAPDIEAIQNLLPNRQEVDRQTLLFSATVPQGVMQIVKRTMKPHFEFVRTVQEGEQQTHERVPQKVVEVRGFENVMPALLELCQRELARKDAEPFKAIVYFNATAEVTLAASTFENLANPGTRRFEQHPLYPAQIIEMHARLSQDQRTRAADTFRRAKTGIMFSSDVTARGMDFPNVTHVIQVGVPGDRDTYIHRIGRTARGDKKGEGWLLITEMETREVKSRLYKLPLQPDQSLETAKVDMTQDAQLPEYVARTLTQVVNATKMVKISVKSAAYLAAFGIYQWIPKKQQLVDSMNNRAKFGWSMERPPAIPSGLAQKLGLSRLTGINTGPMEYEVESAISPGRQFGPSGFNRDRDGSSSGGFSRGGRPSGGFSRDSGRSRGGFGGGTRDGGEGRSSYGGGRSSYGEGRSSYSGGRPSYGEGRSSSNGNRDRSSLSRFFDRDQ